jgi:27-O-demethylrifamycin SV methyltransferase
MDKRSLTASSIAPRGSLDQKRERFEFSVESCAHYDRVTDAWQYLIGDDLHVGYFSDPDCDLLTATRALTRLMAESAELEPGKRVLDVGCGTGNPAVQLATEYGCQVLGISNSRIGVERARSRARERSAQPNVDFCVASGTANELPNESFDCVWVMESSHLMPEKEQLARECTRVLRKGGRLVLCDLMLRRELPVRPGLGLAHDLVVLQEVYGRADLQFLEDYGKQFEACEASVKCRDISEQVAPTFEHWCRNAEHYRSRAADIFGEGHVERFERSCGIMTHLFANGQLGYGMVTARK